MKFNFSVHHDNGKVIVSESDWEKVLVALSSAGYEVKQSFTPAQQSVHWTAYAVLAAGLVVLGVWIGSLLFGG